MTAPRAAGRPLRSDAGSDGAAGRGLLMIGYHFPPRGGVAAQRLIKFARYLPDHGWRPTVVTPRGASEEKVDRSLLAQVAAVAVVRTPAVGVDRMHTWLRRLMVRCPFRALRRRSRGAGWADGAARGGIGAAAGGAGGAPGGARRVERRRGPGVRARLRWILFPDDKVGWTPWAVAAGRRLAASGGYAAIYSTSPPPTAHLAGLALRRLTGLPWVADFRDPWSTHTSLYFPTPWHRQAARRLERAVLWNASAVICTTDTVIRDLAAAHPGVPDSRFVLIPNGYDPQDFQARARRPRDRITVVYTGTFPSFAPGARRNPIATLDALAMLAAEHPDIRGRFALELIGPGEAHLRALAHARGLGDMVTIRGFLPHEETLQAMLDADVLLLVGGIAEVTSIGVKTFEYLAAGRPIMAVMPEGENARLCREIGVAALVAPDDVVGIKDALWLAAAAGRDGLPLPSPAAAARYTRQRLTAQLAQVLDRVAAGTPGPAGG